MVKFCFGQSEQKLPENKGKVLFYVTYFEKSYINRKPLIWPKDKKIMKFGHKKRDEFCFGQCVRELPEY